MRKTILVKYGELTLKGKNRRDFENRLLENLQVVFADVEGIRFQKAYGRLFVHCEDAMLDEVKSRLRLVFGIHAFTEVEVASHTLSEIEEAALRLVQAQDAGKKTFKVETRRPYKEFPLTAMEMNHHLGGHLLRNTSLKVDVHQPDLRLMVEIRQEGVYMYCGEEPGMGGLPVGSSGRVLLLLSGGIDSPVAGWLSLKRGVDLEAIHFHSYPFTSQMAQQKVEDLVQKLTPYGGKIRLHIVPVTEIQTEIRKHVPDGYSITILRRMMFRIAERLAHQRKALALVTGESLGQVASQTLESLRTIEQVVELPVLRPLISYDKREIIQLAEEIGTYEISILPYEDCCTIFAPRSPKTRPKPEVIRKWEEKLDVEGLLEKSLAQAEYKEFYPYRQEKQYTYF